MVSIKLENVVKVYPNGQVAVRGVDLEVGTGELMVVVGPSGSGKTTILRIVAGLETPTHGRISLDGRDVTGLPPWKRNLAMVFQNYALHPHKTVRQNLAFGLQMKRVRTREIAQQLGKVARTLGLEPFLDRRPGQLSGGERQRVALGRAIVREPKAFLLDEPLSNLDAQLRVHTRAELARLHRQLGATMLYVTHDQEEALTLGDRVAVLREGSLHQVGSPLEIYQHPANVFVGGFIGSPAMNFFRCRLRSEGGKLHLESPWFKLDLTPQPPSLKGKGESLLSPLRGGVGGEVLLLGVRPPDIQLCEPTQADAAGRVEVIQPLGSRITAQVCLSNANQNPGPEEARLTMILPADIKLGVDDPVGIHFQRDRLHLFDAASGRRLD